MSVWGGVEDSPDLLLSLSLVPCLPVSPMAPITSLLGLVVCNEVRLSEALTSGTGYLRAHSCSEISPHCSEIITSERLTRSNPHLRAEHDITVSQ